jgi:membrane fusion protein YbhG
MRTDRVAGPEGPALRTLRGRPALRTGLLLLTIGATGCHRAANSDTPRVSGQVEATEVQVAPEVGGRVLEIPVVEGDRIKKGDLIATLDTRDVDLALRRADAERGQADAQLRLLLAGSRPEDIGQAQAQVTAAAGDVSASQAELAGAEADFQRFDRLLQSNSGSQKQRDDAATRRDVARDRLASARGREAAAREAVARLRAGARREEVEAARARVAAVDAQIATIQKSKADATVLAPIDGVISERLLDPGEMAAPRAPIVVLTDLDHAWAEVFVDEPQVPTLKLGQTATVITDAGNRIPGKVSFISTKAEFTPRNVQTAEDRSKLVYRVKIAVDNRQGVLKQGMPVEAEIPVQ